MYSIDERDEVIRIEEFPQSSVGAPCPIVLSDEHVAMLAYSTEDEVDPKWNVNVDTTEELYVVVTFERYWSMMFGAPNDDTLNGHPLYSRGLKRYSVFEVKNSSWIRMLEKMNSVHPYHKQDTFLGLHHFILTFHDSTFECVAKNFTVKVLEGPVGRVINEMQKNLNC
jgi:hypothetical protein